MSSISKKNTNTNTHLRNKRATLSSNLITSNIITTPCEKVLSILRQVKNFIFNFSKEQTKLIQNLDWCIKIITSRSLYSYELKEKETINKLSEDNPEFKQLVDFVSEYNEKVIKMNRKYNYILSDKLLEKSSTKLNKRRIERKNSFGEKDLNFGKFFDIDELIKQNKNNNKNNSKNKTKPFDRRQTIRNPYFHSNLRLKYNTAESSKDNNSSKIDNSNTNTNNINNYTNNTNSNKNININNNNSNNNSNKFIKIDNKTIHSKFLKIENNNNINRFNSSTINNSNNISFKNDNNNPFDENIIKNRIKKNKKKLININDEKNINKTCNNTNDSFGNISSTNNSSNFITPKIRKVVSPKTKFHKNNKSKFFVSFDQNYLNKKTKNIFPSVQKISITINNDNNDVKEDYGYDKRKSLPISFNSFNALNISLTNKIVCPNNNDNNTSNPKIKKMSSKSRKNVPHIKEYSYEKVQNKLIHEGYDISKLITEKNFDIFELKELIGYNNVLPIIGRVILENLGLLDEEILNISKLDKFLISVSNQYKSEVLYHNSLHGSDVTQSVYIFFTHSNAEKLAKTNVIDLLSIIIAALGHDIGHPGLTNTFHINDSTDLAITYNDVSVLENFHASTLFRTIRKTENNIFDKLTTIDYKIIRKRMISEILATDMANHGKVISLLKSKISLNENNEYKLKLLSGNEQTKNEEQQSLLDFMIHLADLAHNTKLFNISKKWVELLSEEFWKQGDLEKELNLPVSFLCDREQINIPQSQKGFISGYVIPTFENLVTIFPTLKFTLDNANNNLKEWQKLLDKGRKKGWTPPKSNIDKKRNINNNLCKSIIHKKLIFGDFSSSNETKKENSKNDNNNKIDNNNKNENNNIIDNNKNENNNIENNNITIPTIISNNSEHTKNDLSKSRNSNNNNSYSNSNNNHNNHKFNTIDINKIKKNINNTVINSNVNNSTNNTINNSSKKNKNRICKFDMKRNHIARKCFKIKINLKEKSKTENSLNTLVYDKNSNKKV